MTGSAAGKPQRAVGVDTSCCPDLRQSTAGVTTQRVLDEGVMLKKINK